MIPKNIVVYPSGLALSRIWAAMEQIVEVRFQFCNHPNDSGQADAAIFLSADHASFDTVTAAGTRCFVFHSASGPATHTLSRVQFADSPLLDSRLRSRSLPHMGVPLASIDLRSGDTVIAQDAVPIWIKRSCSRAPVDLLAVPFPVLANNEDPLDYFHGFHFIQLLPLLHFLREIVGQSGWHPPPLRACFMFDDPNLHWSSYGYIPYPELSRLAQARNFHVAFATVPLDSWFVHQPTAALFRANTQRLSLLFHGNDHIRAELGRDCDQNATLALLAKSIKRIVSFERRSGLALSRVMAPPHGACRPQTLNAMLDLGFEGACVSPWSLRDWGGEHRWPDSFGLEVSEFVSCHFPISPRFKMSPDCSGAVVISAFLNQPIIPVGHHNTLADGIDLLAQLADTINSLGHVHWANLESILRTNLLTRRDGSTLHLKPYSLRFRITIPQGIDSMNIVPPGMDPGEACPAAYTLRRPAAPETMPERVAAHSIIPASPGETIEVSSTKLQTLDYRSISLSLTNPWAPLRRLICEARDRFQPVKPRRRNRALHALQKLRAVN